MTEIKPALTAEEWVVWLRDGARVPEMVDECYRVVFGGRSEDGSRHAQAAVALHEQPFGFTHRDVENHRGRSAHLHACGIRNVYTLQMADWHESMADRIEALLPPEETHAKRQREDTDNDAQIGHHGSQVSPGGSPEDDDTSGQGSG